MEQLLALAQPLRKKTFTQFLLSIEKEKSENELY